MLSFFGTELSRRVRSHFPASWGMGPDEKWQRGILFLTRNYHNITEHITETSFSFVLSECIVCYDRRRACAINYWPITDVISNPKVKVIEHERDGLSHVWCHQTYFYLPRCRRPGTGDIATPPVCLPVCPSVRQV